MIYLIGFTCVFLLRAMIMEIMFHIVTCKIQKHNMRLINEGMFDQRVSYYDLKCGKVLLKFWVWTPRKCVSKEIAERIF